ncbi:MAG: hypothetical protein LIP28_03085, partial [Deltaproteobacteria bacterium]|nr:hypothetical protein [Deltaproteobacteria bacterium]
VLVLLIGLSPTPFLRMVTPSVDKLLTDHTIRANKAVVVSIDGSEVVRSTRFASTAVKMVMEPGTAVVPSTHRDTLAEGPAPAALADAALVVADNQGEAK